MTTPRAYTAAEVRTQLIDYIRDVVQRGGREPLIEVDAIDRALGKTPVTKRIEQAVFSILVALDGLSSFETAFRLVTDPHPDNEAFLREEGQNWIPSGVDITEDAYLHELFYAPERAIRERLANEE